MGRWLGANTHRDGGGDADRAELFLAHTSNRAKVRTPRLLLQTKGFPLTDTSTYGQAKALRRAMTPPEARLWVHVRRKALGWSIRRQHPVGAYILDFYCPAARLAIEVDGAFHDEPSMLGRDRRRDAWLARQGIEVLRIPAVHIRNELDAVLDQLQREIASRIGQISAAPSTASRSPSPQAGRRIDTDPDE